MRTLLLIVAILCAGCNPPCKRGHQEIVHVEERWVIDIALLGQLMGCPTCYGHMEPAHDEAYWVCDEREPKR